MANYFFDTTPHDCFAVERGALQECCPAITCDGPRPEEGDPDLLTRISVAYDRRPADPEPYDDADWNEVLRGYAARLDDTVVTFPVSVLRSLKNLSALAGGRMMLLVGDEGYLREEDLLGQPEPRLAPHGGSFSMPVNYHAVAEVVRRRGGRVLLPPRHFHLAVAAFLLGDDAHDWAETRLAFDEAVTRRGPDAFYSIKKGIDAVCGGLDAEQLLAWLRFSGWDARVFTRIAPGLIHSAPTVGEPLRQEWIRAVGRVWDSFFPIGEADDIPFVLGQVLAALGRPDEALPHFLRSLELHGPTADTHYYVAECHQHLGRVSEALASVDQGLELEPDAGALRALRLRLLARSTPESS